MFLHQLIEEIYGSSYNLEDVKEVLQVYKNIHYENNDLITLHTYLKYKENLSSNEIIEKQYYGNRLWHEMCIDIPREIIEEKYFNPERGQYKFTQLVKDYPKYTDKQLDYLLSIYKYNKRFDFFGKEVTEKILEADDYRCRICGRSKEDVHYRSPIQTHHIMPGGGDHFENGVTVCYFCHYTKIHKPKKLPDIDKGQFYNRKLWKKYLEDFDVKYRKPIRTKKGSKIWDPDLRSYIYV